MSYARFGADGSDVYVFGNMNGEVECCGCILQECEWVDAPDRPIFKGYLKAVGEIIPYHFTDPAEAIAHFDRHRAAGHVVPQEVYDRTLDPEGIAARAALPRRRDKLMTTYCGGPKVMALAKPTASSDSPCICGHEGRRHHTASHAHGLSCSLCPCMYFETAPLPDGAPLSVAMTDALRCTEHISERAIRAGYILTDLKLRGWIVQRSVRDATGRFAALRDEGETT